MTEVVKIVDDNGAVRYYKEGTETLHREDGPAVIHVDGIKEWYINGKRHREDGPAVVYPDGNQYWYIEGKELTEEEFNDRMKYDIDKTEGGATYYFKRGTFTLHREDGPAVIYPNGDKSWYIDGVLHREDGPAIDLKGGYKAWYKDAKLHREDGPAVIKENGSKLWYIEGVNVTEEELNERMKYDIDKTEDGTNYYFKKGTKILHREDGPAIDLNDRYKAWYKDGELHREDGPAILYKFGHEEWHLNGNLHREDGPAIISGDGSQYWYINGQYHREDGPALILYNGYKSWYINGKELTEEEFNEFSKYDIVEECGGTYYYKKGTRTLHREDGPAVVYTNGTKEWYQNGKRHREGGPAVVFAGGNQYWYKNGELHREDGPAAEYEDGDRAWYINGKLHREGAPAVVYANGDTKGWYINGELHREDGPAFEYADGDDEWYLNGEEVTEEEVMNLPKKVEITTGAFILKIDGESLAFETRSKLFEYLETKL